MRVTMYSIFPATNPGFAETRAPGRFATVENGRLYYESCGTGSKAIVLFHDGLMHSAAFDEVWPMLCERFRVIRYDRRGYGRSPAVAAPIRPRGRPPRNACFARGVRG
jgi:pimeloyl-ACP methyl ester carboxylesterase